MGSFEFSGDAQDIADAGYFAFIAYGSVISGLTIIDITQSQLPTVTSHTLVSEYRLHFLVTLLVLRSAEGVRYLPYCNNQSRTENVSISVYFANVVAGSGFLLIVTSDIKNS
jgi:LVIVD repeat-containing protein